jgi:hypothetical protein
VHQKYVLQQARDASGLRRCGQSNQHPSGMRVELSRPLVKHHQAVMCVINSQAVVQGIDSFLQITVR